VAKAEWSRVVPELEKTGVLTLVDGAALEAYCSAYASAVWFQRVAHQAPMVRTKRGDLRANPAVAEARKHWALVRQLGSEFGLTPAARTRVGAPAGDGKGDETADFLFGPLRVVHGGAGK